MSACLTADKWQDQEKLDAGGFHQEENSVGRCSKLVNKIKAQEHEELKKHSEGGWEV